MSFDNGKVIVTYVRSNEYEDIFQVSTNTGLCTYVSFPRSSAHNCESVAAFY